MVSEAVTSLVVSETQRAIDLEMVPFDIRATSVHVEMLAFTGIISREVSEKLLSALVEILESWKRGTFVIDPSLGAQLTLEREVIQRVGDDVGLSMHTARSRNDQVMVTEMLYVRSKCEQLIDLAQSCTKDLYAQAEQAIGVPMPGYTHMQPGKPTALSHWYLAHGDSLTRGVESLKAVLEQYDRCPLGAVESFGTSWPIDRLYVAQRLGFSQVWEVPQDAISSRGVFQLAVLAACNQFALSVAKIAADLMLYSTFEYRMVVLGDAVAERLHPITGSSVMAQKRNPDALELLRASAAQFAGFYASVSSVLCGLPTGYNRDSRETKEYIAIAFRKLFEMFHSLRQVVRTTSFDEKRMRQMIDENYSLTTDLADRLAQATGIPYRRMYKIVGVVVNDLMQSGKPLTSISVSAIVDSAKRLGATISPGSLDVMELLSVDKALGARAHVGGTCAERTREMLARRAGQYK